MYLQKKTDYFGHFSLENSLLSDNAVCLSAGFVSDSFPDGEALGGQGCNHIKNDLYMQMLTRLMNVSVTEAS